MQRCTSIRGNGDDWRSRISKLICDAAVACNCKNPAVANASLTRRIMHTSILLLAINLLCSSSFVECFHNSFIVNRRNSVTRKGKQISMVTDGPITKESASTFDINRTNYWNDIASYVFDTSIEIDENTIDHEGQPTKGFQQQHPHSKPIVLFDGVCNLCNDAANFVIDHDESGKFRFASLQSNVAKGLLLREGKDPALTSDVVLVTNDSAYYSSMAIAKIMAELDLPKLQFLGIIGQKLPPMVREPIYKFVSGNRFIFGKKNECRLDFTGEFTARFVSDPPSETNPPQPLSDTTKLKSS